MRQQISVPESDPVAYEDQQKRPEKVHLSQEVDKMPTRVSDMVEEQHPDNTVEEIPFTNDDEVQMTVGDDKTTEQPVDCGNKRPEADPVAYEDQEKPE